MVKFSVNKQIITRTDNIRVVARSRNYLFAQFSFETDEWQGVKTAIFARGDDAWQVVLDSDNKCLVPWEWLRVNSLVFGQVSVFCGDLVTANTAKVAIEKSGYTDALGTQKPTPSVFEQLVELIQEQTDTLASIELDYVADKLALLLNGEIKTSVEFREVELKNNGTAIQWKYKSDTEWKDLVLLEDLRGKQGLQGLPGADGADGVDGTDGTNGIDGIDGKSAFETAVDAGYTGTEADFYVALARVAEKVSSADITELKVVTLSTMQQYLSDGTAAANPTVNYKVVRD